jgi:hypothetical protein
MSKWTKMPKLNKIPIWPKMWQISEKTKFRQKPYWAIMGQMPKWTKIDIKRTKNKLKCPKTRMRKMPVKTILGQMPNTTIWGKSLNELKLKMTKSNLKCLNTSNACKNHIGWNALYNLMRQMPK